MGPVYRCSTKGRTSSAPRPTHVGMDWGPSRSGSSRSKGSITTSLRFISSGRWFVSLRVRCLFRCAETERSAGWSSCTAMRRDSTLMSGCLAYRRYCSLSGSVRSLSSFFLPLPFILPVCPVLTCSLSLTLTRSSECPLDRRLESDRTSRSARDPAGPAFGDEVGREGQGAYPSWFVLSLPSLPFCEWRRGLLTRMNREDSGG